jgi:enolase
MKIRALGAREILDSRGNPTVEAECELSDGARARASVPSGRSTGAAEALELRDGDPARYRGLGCRRAVGHVRGEIALALRGRDFQDSIALDAALHALDGTPNCARLGANAMLAVSIAFARAMATSGGLPLYRYFASLVDAVPRMPTLTVNLFSGGEHGGRQMAVQDILLVPAAGSVDGSLAFVHEVYARAAAWQHERHGMRLLRADEGGLAPPFSGVEEGLAVAALLAGAAGGGDVCLAMDVAASHFHRDGRYEVDGRRLDADSLVARIAEWCEAFPVVSVEDGLDEEAWGDWPGLVRRLAAKKVAVMGDDFLCTQPERIRRAIAGEACNALLLKVNQAGTLARAAEALALAREAGWSVTVSARSGETEDDWLADLAVGWRGDQIKIGSITQSDRLSKYNRLLAIEAEGQVAGWNS